MTVRLPGQAVSSHGTDDRGRLGVAAAPRSRRRLSERVSVLRRLYHLAEADNLDSILAHGLLSTRRLVERSELPPDEQLAILRGHRRTNVTLPTGVLIRDQRPMPPSALKPALYDGLTPGDWYALLNSYVFLWPSRDRMDRQRKACGTRPQFVLTFDAEALLTSFAAHAFVSPINSGNARRKPARRGLDTILAYNVWLEWGWPTGQRDRPTAEFLFSCNVPTAAPYLISIDSV